MHSTVSTAAPQQTLSVKLNIESGWLWIFDICWYCLTNNYYLHHSMTHCHHLITKVVVMVMKDEKSNYFWSIVIFATLPFYAALVSTNLWSKARAQRLAAGVALCEKFSSSTNELEQNAKQNMTLPSLQPPHPTTLWHWKLQVSLSS